MSFKKNAMLLPLKLSWFTTKHSARLSYKFVRHCPSAAMLISALGLVACSSDNAGVGDSVRNGVEYITPSNPFKRNNQYSPYGGTDKPSSVKIGSTYNVKGQNYTPKYEPTYTETGMASWYGPNFHGRQTANGERYNQHAMTAAHRTLPLPSMVKVTRTDTGKSVMVRVNDRGPFSHGRIIDLSEKAAKELNMIGTGTAHVKVEYMPERTVSYLKENDIPVPDYMAETAYKTASYQQSKPKTLPSSYTPSVAKDAYGREAYRPELRSRTASARVASADNDTFSVNLSFDDIIKNNSSQQAASSSGHKYNVQTASFANRLNAERHMQKLEGVGNARMREIVGENGTYYRVMVGPVKEYEQAVMLMDRTKELGIEGAKIVID
jgi:rare lipoprotein A